MTLLLDTHAFLWWRADDRRLRQNARRSIASADRVLVSAASGWEAAIKISLGRLELSDPFAWMVEDSGFTALPVTLAHAARFAAVPRHHADPFDRMLVAQAQAEAAAVVTHDRAFEPYGVEIVWT